MSVVVAAVGPEDFEALAALFERDHSPCYCRYWHFGGTNKEWEARCAFAPHENREELGRALAARSDEARGLVARMSGSDEVVGWMKLAPRRALPKLLARSTYRELDDPGDVWSIGCFLVDPAHRRQGVARALVEGAIPIARSWGARFLEAYPRVFEGMHDFEQWTGPMPLYEQLGFTIVRDQVQYPVVRRAL